MSYTAVITGWTSSISVRCKTLWKVKNYCKSHYSCNTNNGFIWPVTQDLVAQRLCCSWADELYEIIKRGLTTGDLSGHGFLGFEVFGRDSQDGLHGNLRPGNGHRMWWEVNRLQNPKRTFWSHLFITSCMSRNPAPLTSKITIKTSNHVN